MFGMVDGKMMGWRGDKVMECQSGGKSCVSWKSKQRKSPEKVPKMRGPAWLETCSQTGEKSGFFEEKCALFWISRQRKNECPVSYTASGYAKKKSCIHPLHIESENCTNFLHNTKQNLHDPGKKIKS